MVEDMFLRQSDDFVMSVAHPSDDSTKKTLAQAQSFIADHEVFCWVETQNVTHGVAPSSVAARVKFEEARSKLGLAVGEVTPKHARQWARRRRRRWPVKRGSLKRSEPISAEDAIGKATLQWVHRPTFSVIFFAKPGPIYRPAFRADF